MNSPHTQGSPLRIVSAGQVLFAAVMIWLGVLGLVKGTFVEMWQPVPKWVPAREALVYLTASISLATGIGLLFRRSAAIAARVIFASLVIWLLVLRVPNLFYEKPLVLVAWTFGSTAVMVAAAWVLYVWFAGDADRSRVGGLAGDTGVRVAQALFGVSLIPFGLAHFMYLDATTVLIPHWLPWPAAWAYFTGAAFIAAGVAMALGVYGRVAAALCTLQLFLFSMIIWVPRAWAGNLSDFQKGEFVSTWVLTAGAWVVAESYTRMGQRQPMKAVVCTRYGPPEVLQVRDVDRPVAGARDLLIKIHSAGVTVSDCYMRSGVPTAKLWFRIMMWLFVGFKGPRRPILGAVLAGEVVETGRRVTRFRVGDRVYAFTLLRLGCYAEYTRLPETAIVALAPKNFTDEDAAAIPYGGLIAWQFLEKAQIQRGWHVLIYGASGAIGTAAVQLAKHAGAHVTAVCSTANIDLVRSLGADEVLDYTATNSPGDRRFDLVFDAAGRRKTSPLKTACEQALMPGGKNVSVDGGRPWPKRDDLAHLTKLAEAGALTPVIDRRYSLDEIAEAHRYVEQGHKKGNVILQMR